MKSLSLFSGIGGIELALSQIGIEPVAFCDWEKYCQQILTRRWPDIPVFGDIKELDVAQLQATGVPIDGIKVITGGYPCFASGTMVLTSNGYRPIESIVIGDIVLTHLGHWKPVTNVIKTLDRSTIQVKSQGCNNIVCTPKHYFYAAHLTKKYNQTLRKYEKVSEGLDWVQAQNLEHCCVSQVLPPIIEDDYSCAFWKLIGRYLADGWMTDFQRKSKTPRGLRGSRVNSRCKKVVLCCSHEERCDVAKLINDAGFHATQAIERTVVKFQINNRGLWNFVQAFGRYAHGKTIPGWVLSLCPEKARALLDGWVSGDGGRIKNKTYAVTTSEALALGMCLLVHRAYNLAACIDKHVPRKTKVIENRIVNQRPWYRVSWSHKNREPVVSGDYILKPVRHIKSGPICDVYDLTVEDDHSFIANGCIVHNCQSHSVAGKRKGRDDERHLWPEMFRLIQSISPDYIIGENVEGLLSSSDGTVFGDVLKDMSSLGYRVGWCCYPASDIGCAHERYRVFSFGLRETHSGWMPDKKIVMDAIMAWLAYAKWPSLPGYKQRVYEPPRVIFDDKDKDRTKRVKAIGNAVCPMQIFPISLALMCRGEMEYIDFSDVPPEWLEACVNVRMFDKKLAVLEECFRFIKTVIKQPTGKIFAHLDNDAWHQGAKPFIGKPGQPVSKWKKWGYIARGSTCIDYKHDFNTTTLRTQFPPYHGDIHHGSEQWRDMDEALWRTPTSECGVKITSLMDKDGNPPSKLGVTTYRRNKDGTTAVQSVTLNQQIEMCREWEMALWATPQANTTTGELPEYLVNSSGGEPQPGQKMYRRDSGRMIQTALTTQVKMWPGEFDVAPEYPISILWPRPSTHNASEIVGWVYSPSKTSETIERTARSDGGKRAMMNPDWEEVLMGFPVGWTKSNL